MLLSLSGFVGEGTDRGSDRGGGVNVGSGGKVGIYREGGAFTIGTVWAGLRSSGGSDGAGATMGAAVIGTVGEGVTGMGLEVGGGV